jgi:hypothetical protein
MHALMLSALGTKRWQLEILGQYHCLASRIWSLKVFISVVPSNHLFLIMVYLEARTAQFLTTALCGVFSFMYPLHFTQFYFISHAYLTTVNYSA